MRFDRTAVLCILYLAVFGTVVTFLLYFWALERLPVTHIALIAYLTPVVAILIGVLWLGESMTPRVLLGAAVVIAGVVVAGRAARRPAVPRKEGS